MSGGGRVLGACGPPLSLEGGGFSAVVEIGVAHSMVWRQRDVRQHVGGARQRRRRSDACMPPTRTRLEDVDQLAGVRVLWEAGLVAPPVVHNVHASRGRRPRQVRFALMVSGWAGVHGAREGLGKR